MIVQFWWLIVCRTRYKCHLGAWKALFVRSLDMMVTASRVYTLPESGLHQRCSVAGSPGLPWPPVTDTFLSMHCPHFRLQVLPMSISMCSSMCILQRMLEHIKTYQNISKGKWKWMVVHRNTSKLYEYEAYRRGPQRRHIHRHALWGSGVGFNNEVSPGCMGVPLFHVCLLFCVWICNLLNRAGNEGLQWFHNHGKGPY